MRTSVSLLVMIALAGCGRTGSTDTVTPAQLPGNAVMSSLPLGDPHGSPRPPGVANPFEGDATAVAQGKQLFAAMNCVYCHGTQGSGLIGPPLDSKGWRYGGTPAQIYNSIHDGRPGGMPAWGASLPPDQIWRLTAYIESLGGADPPATPSMAAVGGATPSTTGPQPAGEAPTDSAHASLVAGDKDPEAR
jgi:mono/diheme cytochrome c family protein